MEALHFPSVSNRAEENHDLGREIGEARKPDRGERADVECGMAKLFATEACFEVVSEAMRVHGGYGFSKEYEVERLYRDAPLLIIGEGTNEIQRLIIAKGLLERYRIAE